MHKSMNGELEQHQIYIITQTRYIPILILHGKQEGCRVMQVSHPASEQNSHSGSGSATDFSDTLSGR